MKDCKNLIYALRCPMTDEYMYIGKSSIGIKRAYAHFTYSHNHLVNIWMKELKGKKTTPVIDILEYCNADNLNDREIWWIKFYSDIGCNLFNKQYFTGKRELLNDDISEQSSVDTSIGTAIRHRRMMLGFGQDRVASASGVSRRTLVSVEKDKKGVSMHIYRSICIYLGMDIGVVAKKKKENNVLWLDDLRNPYVDYDACGEFKNNGKATIAWVRSFEEFVSWIEINGLPLEISFDYDLGEDIAKMRVNRKMPKKEARKNKKNEKTGLDCAIWLLNYCKKNNVELPKWDVHSANPDGKKKIMELLSSFKSK